MQLTRRRVISVATTLIERDGVGAFSMAKLATELGCSIMVLYGYVPSRSELLDGVADQVLARVAAPGVPPRHWEDQVRALAAAIRQVARTFPACATLAFSRQPLVPAAAEPGKAGPGKVASGKAAPMVATLRDAGLSGPDATRMVRTLTAYVIGSVLCELGPADADADFEFGLGMLIRAAATLCPPATGNQSAVAAGRATPAPAASIRASTAGTDRATERPAALAMPPMSTGPPSMPA